MKYRNHQIHSDACATHRNDKSGRILARTVARELTPEELVEIAGGVIGQFVSYCGPCSHPDDVAPC